MTKIISNSKNYQGSDLEKIFFRPVLMGQSAVDLGVKVLYNMPVPTTLNFWKQGSDLLKKYAKGWAGTDSASQKFQKTIDLSKVKAEMGYSASDYFGMVYEQITGRSDVDFDNLEGTELETAETELFKKAIVESIRATMWVGNTSRANGYNTFDGFLKKIKADAGAGADDVKTVAMTSMTTAGNAEKLFKALYDKSLPELRSMKAEGQLVFLVTRDVYENYEAGLLDGNLDSARLAKISGIDKLYYRGIPVADIQADTYLADLSDLPKSWAILTDRRNMAVAVNTADFPGSEVSMWYNPDQIENRQRAIFAAGCDYLLPELIVASFSV